MTFPSESQAESACLADEMDEALPTPKGFVSKTQNSEAEIQIPTQSHTQRETHTDNQPHSETLTFTPTHTYPDIHTFSRNIRSETLSRPRPAYTKFQ